MADDWTPVKDDWVAVTPAKAATANKFEVETPDQDVPFQTPPGAVRGTVLPFMKDPSGNISLAMPEILAAPIRGAVKGGQAILGERSGMALAGDRDVLAATIPAGFPTYEEAALMAAGKGVAAGAGAAGKAAAATARGAGRATTDIIGGLGTHTGGESLRQAFKAGLEGGEKAQLFLDSMRGNQPMETVVETAKDALAKMREARSAAYEAGMADIEGDASRLSFDGIKNAINDMRSAAEYKGVVVNPEAAAKLKDIEAAVNEWEKADPAEFHTVLGFDALKQRIGAILEQTTPHTRASAITGRAYNAVRDEITRQAPTYGKVMKEYEEASSALRDLESGLSLKDSWAKKGVVDTALRKLQSVMRNNVATNYGYRLKQVEELNERSDGKIVPQLAGHALSSLTPRGLGNLAATATGVEAFSHPWLVGALPFQSPRLMGETMYGLGAGARQIGRLANPFKPIEGPEP